MRAPCWPVALASVVLIGCAFAGAQSDVRSSAGARAEIRPATGTSGMVSSAHPEATRVGIEILREGGNAFDAAVAAAAALNVVEPAMSGVGGYGTILVYDAAKRESRFLNPSGRIPRSVDSDVFRPPTPGYQANRRGAKAVSTPGNLHAWEALSNTYGRLPWARVLAPAITLAERGFAVDRGMAALLKDVYTSFPEHARGIYGINGQPLREGDRLVQADLARSLRRIVEQGPRALYGGELGRAVDQAMREAGGFLSLADLEADQAEWWKPISISYRGYEVVTASPPANAFDMLVRLGMMGRFDVEALGPDSVAYLHRFAEVTKHAFRVRLEYAGDPDVSPPPLGLLLSEKYWTEQVSRLDLKRASHFVPPGLPGRQSHTTHFVVADRWGNVVSATQTLGNAFGSRIMPRGTGIWLNNSLEYCTFEPKGNPMDAHAGRRKLSGDCPTLVMRDGRPWIAIGTPGGHTIGQVVPQIVMNLVDFRMDVARAIAAGRISFVEPDDLAVEPIISEAVRSELAAMGHRVRVFWLGNAHGLTIEYDRTGRPARFLGAADPRGGGLAAGY
jgi:gamma-glutamyltranspeptidase / glutathione hydrolase